MSGPDDVSDPEQLGIMPRSFEDVFKQISDDSDQTQFLVRASYLEIYNESVRDLLAKNPKSKLDLHEDPDKGVYVKDLSYFAVKKASEVHEVMRIGNKNRQTASTNMNARSSRSHSLF
jgi:kinesin family protein 3/17